MKGYAFIVLCAVALGQTEQVKEQRSSNGETCPCSDDNVIAACTRDGNQGELFEHQNCNQFYKCSNGQAIPYFCPADLVYNHEERICDWPQNVDCGNRPIVEIELCPETEETQPEPQPETDNDGTCNSNPGEAPGICAADGSDGTLVANENCNQFYKCDNGVPVTVSCPVGLVYNPYIECCDWPANVDCGDKPIAEIGGGNGDGDNGSGDNDDSDSSENGSNGGTCNCNPSEAPGICAADGSDGTLVANENCNQFYKCDNGVPVTISCPAGLVYNPYIECCDWPANVDCGDKPIAEIGGGNGNGDGDNGNGNGNGENGNGDNGNGDNGSGDSDSSENGSNGGTCNCNPGEAPGICAIDGSDGTLVAHENCNQFYTCANGAPVTITCPAHLVYNPYIERCDWPENVECGDKPIVEVDGESNGDNGSGDNGSGDSGSGDSGSNENGSNGGTCNCNPGEAPSICAADGSDGTLVANENCNQFYKCDNGVPVTISCPAGLVYNPYIECCDWPANVDCGDKPIVEGAESNGNGENDNGSGNGNGDNGNVDNGNGDNGSGDNASAENGSNGGTCNCNPGEAPSICAVDGSDGTLIAHENCNQFYKCNQGGPVAFVCPSGLLYNPYLEVCDWPENVECGEKPIVEGDGGNGNGDTGSGNGNGDNGSGDNGSGDNGSAENGSNGGTCNCNPGEAPSICAVDGSDGTLIAHENCNQFYKCDQGGPVAFVCPSGLLYNPYLEVCDWPENVDCGDKPIVEGDEGNGNGDNGNGDNGSGDTGSGDNGSAENESNGGTCNCNPGEAPSICAVDGSDGTLIAHENCNQFYKCDQGGPVALVCPSGLLYNPYLEVCDWPENVECGEKPIVEGGGGNGNGDNGSGNGNGDNGSGDNGSGDNGSTENGSNGGTCNCNPGEAPSICAVDGSDGTLIAHENCNHFYKCDQGGPVALVCPSGLLYNPYLEVCDWPENVECGDKPIVEVDGGVGNGDNGSDYNGSGDNGSGDNDSGDNGSNGGTCNCNPGEAPAICATGNAEGVLIAHEKCNKFYKCSFGSPVAFRCPGDLLYNPQTEQCDWPSNVECGDRVITEEDSSIGDKAESQEQNNQENGQNEGNKDPSEAPAICAANDSDGILVAHENCHQFSVCSTGAPVVLSCPGNLLFNPSIEQCDWPANVDCTDRIIPQPEVPEGDSSTCLCNPRQAPSICSSADANGKMIAHDFCSKYYVCFNGLPVVQKCPNGLFYEPVTRQCTTAVSCDDRVYDVFSFNKHAEARRGLFN